MMALLDTHVLLWWLDNPAKLSAPARKVIENSDNVIFVSAAVIWEIKIKKQLGKLDIPEGLLDLLLSLNFTPLSISVEHAHALGRLSGHHQDPFDRIQIAQALHENLVLLSRDRYILLYDEIQRIKA